MGIRQIYDKPDEYKLIRTHWIELYVNCGNVGYNAIYFELEIFQNKFKNLLERKKSQQVVIEYKHTLR